MSTSSYEVEVKCLLGTEENAKELERRMQLQDPRLEHVGTHRQRNHYFIDGDLERLALNLAPFLGRAEKERLQEIARTAKDYSVRTRWADENVFLVVKASVDDTTSANGIARLELEPQIRGLSLEKLDACVLESGFRYQAKWSRERKEYKFLDVKVSIDKNAGYGHVAEFELIVKRENESALAEARLRELMERLGVEELDQPRLERMFKFYNEHWPEYYGTEKVFTVE